MYTIFKNDVSIILTDDLNIIGDNPYLLWKDIRNEMNLNLLIKDVQKSIYIHSDDLDQLWHEFKAGFTIFEASGGIVSNFDKELLFIFRHGKWDLPKGKIEAGESREEAGVREVIEECGFKNIKLGSFIETTYHIYEERGGEILKVSYWYEMFSNDTELKPQVEEGITDLEWLTREDLTKVKTNTYPNIILLLDRYFTVS